MIPVEVIALMILGIIKQSYEQPKIDVDTINSYFLNGDASNVKGEIESSNKMKSVMENSSLQPHISSQYYKKNRVVEKYYDDSYDFYIQIRSDMIIADFPSRENIEEI